ncbi:MAG: rhombosortase [Burkholderiales bacterium 28-67-8]|nr:MAG: rhombosortase [Burkholderiales bacterium 28-67-8]
MLKTEPQRTASRPASAWCWVAMAAALCAGSLIAYALERQGAVAGANPSVGFDWQPALLGTQPWRAWAAAFVHYSDRHLLANLAGALGVAALGLAARVPVRSVLAWALAWPLVQVGLLLQPGLQHYGGLSGVLHAGVAVVATHLLWSPSRTQRRIGMAVLAGLLLKLLGEAPWAGVISHPSGWDIAVAPGAHVSGVLVGCVLAALAEAAHSGLRSVREALGAIDAHD